MTKEELAKRAKNLAVGVFRLAERLPNSVACGVIVKQVLRSSSSVAANYRAALRAKSTADFVNKMKIVLEEADETSFWLTFVPEVGLLSGSDGQLIKLINESNELTAIFAASVKTLTTSNSGDQNLKS